MLRRVHYVKLLYLGVRGGVLLVEDLLYDLLNLRGDFNIIIKKIRL